MSNPTHADPEPDHSIPYDGCSCGDPFCEGCHEDPGACDDESPATPNELYAPCVVCSQPVTHGCNTAVCSEACLAACRPCPVCHELVAPGGDSYCGAYCASIDAAEEREAERRCGC